LFDHARRAGNDDGDARKMLVVIGFGDSQALDVVAAPGEQANDARENAGFIDNENGERVRFNILRDGCGPVDAFADFSFSLAMSLF
jgi:hypothetical protein